MVSVNELARWLNIETPTPSQRLVLRDLEKHTVAFVQEQTGRYFGLEVEFTEIIAGRGTPFLWLNEPATTITSVEERWRPGEAWTALTDYEQRESQLIREDGLVWQYEYEYRVIYDFGYAAGQEPGDIRQLVLDLVKLKWDQRIRAGDVETEQVGPMRITYASDDGTASIPWVRETFDAWRHVPVT